MHIGNWIMKVPMCIHSVSNEAYLRHCVSAVDCDFEQSMCGWTTGRNFSSPVGSNQYWNLCPHLPTSTDLQDTCDVNLGFKHADPFSRHRLHEKWQHGNVKGKMFFQLANRNLPLCLLGLSGFVLTSSNRNVGRPESNKYRTFYTSYVLSGELPAFFLYRCLRYSYAIKGHSVLIVSYMEILTQSRNDKFLMEHGSRWLTNSSEEWISGTQSVDLPLIPNFRIMFRVWFRFKGNNVIHLDNISVTEGICNGSCPLEMFRCSSGECILPSLVCNSLKDCKDMSDEETCESGTVSSRTKDISLEPASVDVFSICPYCPPENNITCVSFCPTSCLCAGITRLCKRSTPSTYIYFVQLSEMTCGALDVLEIGRGIYHFDISFSRIRSFNITDNIKIEKLTVSDSTIETLNIPDKMVNFIQFKNLKANSISFYTNSVYLHLIGNLRMFNASVFLYLPYVNFEGNILSGATVIYQPQSYAIINSHSILVLRNCNIFQTLSVIDVKSNHVDLSHNKLKSFSVNDRTHTLLISNNQLERIVKPVFVTRIMSLKTINMSFNKITYLQQNDFAYFFNLLYIDLKSNNISWIHDETFADLVKLRFLDLSNNFLQTIKETFFQNLENLQYLYLQRNLIRTIELESFYALQSLVLLDLSSNKITFLKGRYFRNLEELRYLYLQNNDFQVSEGMFDGLSSLILMQVDFFSLCCAKPRNVYDIKCVAPENMISSCNNLIAVPILNVGIWYIALFAAFGNFFVFWYKMVYLKRQSAQAHFILTTNLNWADFLMGVYLFIIAIANLVYNGRYGLEDYSWRNSYFCTIAGILATLSSETSTFLVFLITLDRFIAIKFPFSGKGLTRSRAIILSMCSWFISLFLSILPIIPMQSKFFEGYYARSGICISLPLSVVKKSGWQYSMAVFIGLNFLLFMGIFIGQIAIFYEVITVGRNVTCSRSRKRELNLTKSLAAIVFTDICCWIPVGTIGLLTFGGISVSGEVYDWIIVIVLPINSALNPVIYNLTAFMKHKREKHASKSDTLRKECAGLRRKLESVQSMHSNCSCKRKTIEKLDNSTNTETYRVGVTMETDPHSNGIGVTYIKLETTF
ncbi:relaxin receptor 1-like [Saccostrea echinata]|uniref:relaxin receptor 1-like n=1 Tax=Saccostrea echinata TaxID=191078 RepID=UPI002A7FC70A|nr:relaxin receptor 1-like [Saccostrea echinata]